jgi:hypothetical protein
VGGTEYKTLIAVSADASFENGIKAAISRLGQLKINRISVEIYMSKFR